MLFRVVAVAWLLLAALEASAVTATGCPGKRKPNSTGIIISTRMQLDSLMILALDHVNLAQMNALMQVAMDIVVSSGMALPKLLRRLATVACNDSVLLLYIYIYIYSYINRCQWILPG